MSLELSNSLPIKKTADINVTTSGNDKKHYKFEYKKRKKTSDFSDVFSLQLPTLKIET